MIVHGYKAQGENLADVMRWLEATPHQWTSRDSLTEKGQSWDFGVGFDGALELARTGWSAGAKDLNDRLAAVMPPRDKEDSWRYDIAGETPDVGRFLAGDPMHMKRHGHPKGHRPILSIAVNIRIKGSIAAKQIANYGAALVAVIDQLEHAGRRVELIAMSVTQCNGKRVSCGWTVKKAEDQMDLSAIAFSLAHPAANRRIVFGMKERLPRECQDWGYGTGLVINGDDLLDAQPGTFCINGGGSDDSRNNTLDDALKFVSEQINAAAGETLVTLEG